MKILLIYFTGTYNTRYISNLVADKFRLEDNEVHLLEISRDAPVADTSSYDLIGLGYPIYAFNSPLPFNRYLNKLNFSQGQRYFIYKNSGETLALNNSSSRIIKRRLRRQKAQLTGEYHFIMPYNIHFAFDRDFIKELLALNEKLADVLVFNILKSKSAVIKSNAGYDFISAVISVQKVGGPINSIFYKVDPKKCVGCNLCANSCPESNIRLKNGKIKFGKSCAMCMRCSFYCPADAIKIGLLQGWKVNGDYRLNELAQESLPEKPYITEESKGFYRCFIKSYAGINAAYEEMLNQKASPNFNPPLNQ